MKVENRFFEMIPKVVPTGQVTEITLRPLFEHCRFNPDAEYEITHFPMEEDEKRTLTVKPIDGSLKISGLSFHKEQEHVLLVNELEGGDRKHIGDFRVYSVEDDLFQRRPYKGDFHIHSCRSDGRESPGYVAAACRRIGLDFMAVTDHHRYEPSLEAQRSFEGVDHDLRIYPGEEVHPPDNPVHIINFGGRFSVNELFSNEQVYRKGVHQIQSSLPPLPPGVDAYQYASVVWCFDKIREAGGLGIFCHPYWFTNNHYSPSGVLTSHIFDQQPYDAFELLGGYSLREVDSNTLQVARYQEERMGGKQIPIVGASDAHGCERGELFGWYYTIVFSHSPSLADIIASVKGLFSVAVESIPGQPARVYGPFRLVKYALFLTREVLPLHDELCCREGDLMMSHLQGQSDAKDALRRVSGNVSSLFTRLWDGCEVR